jgi:hypothetical protein
MTAVVKPSANPFYVKDDSQAKVKAYRTEMFCIQVGDCNGDKLRYEQFMQSLYPYSPESKFELHMNLGSPRMQTWTKEGDLLIFIEYIELELPERSHQSDPDNKKY